MFGLCTIVGVKSARSDLRVSDAAPTHSKFRGSLRRLRSLDLAGPEPEPERCLQIPPILLLPDAQCGYLPVIFLTTPCNRWNQDPRRNIKGHSPGTRAMLCASQNCKAFGLTAPVPPARYIQTRGTPASTHSCTTLSDASGEVINNAPSTGGWISCR